MNSEMVFRITVLELMLGKSSLAATNVARPDRPVLRINCR
jgi:hypothetical protein